MRTLYSLMENPFRTPLYSIEKLAVKGLESDQVITTIIGWPQNSAISGRLQESHRFRATLGRDSGTVGVNQTYRCKSAVTEIVRSKTQTFAKSFAPLRQQQKIWRKNIFISQFGAGWCVNGHSASTCCGLHTGCSPWSGQTFARFATTTPVARRE